MSRALVDEPALPPHSVLPPEHSILALAVDTLTGPDTGSTPPAATVLRAEGLRSDTVVPDLAEPVPPTPCTAKLADPLLSRTSVTSPEAAPEVAVVPVPVQAALRQSVFASAVLDAVSS